MNQKKWVAVFTALAVVGVFFYFPKILKTLQGEQVQEQAIVADQIENQAAALGQETSTTMLENNLKIEDVKVGTGTQAQTGSTVSVHYVGTFPDGTKFDSSRDRGEPFEFTIGANMVIPGWEEGIVGMKVGGTRKLVIPPELGYGPRNYGPIPGGSTLLFEVELLGVK